MKMLILLILLFSPKILPQTAVLVRSSSSQYTVNGVAGIIELIDSSGFIIVSWQYSTLWFYLDKVSSSEVVSIVGEYYDLNVYFYSESLMLPNGVILLCH